MPISWRSWFDSWSGRAGYFFPYSPTALLLTLWIIHSLEGSKSRGGDITPNISRSNTRWCRVGLERYDERRQARRKSPVLTAQITRPLNHVRPLPTTSVWLCAVRRSVQVRLCSSGCKSEKMFGVIIIILIIIIIIIIIIILRKKRLHAVCKLQKDVCHNLWRAQTALIILIFRKIIIIIIIIGKLTSLTPAKIVLLATFRPWN